ncbi:MAG: DUF86 domain-containing protein [Bacteroidales bacterium]|nr:DUF86 domain-containing protein [Bacteroidales bacterium]MDP3001529.1 DUF86 domain-containing protein [Bacteroidales bacterium]
MDNQILTSFDRLKHISEATGRILKFCENVNEREFIENDMLNSSVLYQFIIIGEAIQYVDVDILKKYPYQWHLPRSFRNYAAHEYFGINLNQVYKTIREIIPDFKVLIDTIIENY